MNNKLLLTGQLRNETRFRPTRQNVGLKYGFKRNSFVLFAAVAFLFIANMPAIKGQPMIEEDAFSHNDISNFNLCDNYIKIDASTNINNFYFIQQFKNREKIIKTPGDTQNDRLILKIPAHDFQPSNPMMYKDFLEFIKADKYPDIEIVIMLNNIRLPAGRESGIIVPTIKIGIAGESHTYRISGQLGECKDKSLHISGKVNIDLKDFGLEPPSKFMGMVKVDNEVFINFGLTLNN